MRNFEQELRSGLKRRPVPAELKARILARVRAEARRRGRLEPKPRFWMRRWQPAVASLVLLALLAGVGAWRAAEERRKGEEARAEVMTALRVTSRALDKMNRNLASHGQGLHEFAHE